jgi:hypothetical protein
LPILQDELEIDKSNEHLISSTSTEKALNNAALSNNSLKISETEVKRSMNFKLETAVSSNFNNEETIFIEHNVDSKAEIFKNRQKLSETLIENIGINILKSSKTKEFALQSDKIICPSFSNRNKLYFEIIPELGIFYPFKKLGFTGSELENKFSLRDKNEFSLEGLQVGLYGRIRKEKSPFYLSAGLTYSTLTEKMSLKYNYTKTDTVQGIISITVSQSGDTITTIYGDIVREHKISGNKIAHYSFQLIDLPIAFGYEKTMDQWVFGIEAGISLNLSLKSKGNILASDTSFINIENVQNDFNRSLGLSYFGGLLVGREFNDFGRLYLATRFRYIPETFSSSQNRINQNYHFAGLNLGYIVRF